MKYYYKIVNKAGNVLAKLSVITKNPDDIKKYEIGQKYIRISKSTFYRIKEYFN